jgi:hypothetical protein
MRDPQQAGAGDELGGPALADPERGASSSRGRDLTTSHFDGRLDAAQALARPDANLTGHTRLDAAEGLAGTRPEGAGVAVISAVTPRVSDGGFIAGQPGRARSLSCTGSQQRRCVR